MTPTCRVFAILVWNDNGYDPWREDQSDYDLDIPIMELLNRIVDDTIANPQTHHIGDLGWGSTDSHRVF